MTAEHVPPPLMDQQLVARVEYSATGANVHKSRSLLCAYTMASSLAALDPSYLAEFRNSEDRLRVFCATGR
jgi:hypothetical protein